MHCLALLPLLACLIFAEQPASKAPEQGIEPDRRHHHHHRRHGRRHGSHGHRHHHHHGHCDQRPPCSLSVCPNKMGNFTIITSPVPWGQAENACGMMGLELARIDINNFMDATNIAFQCSGAQSQTWIKSWNGDAYAGTGLVLSTGNAAPGGAINEVNDGNVGRNVLCQIAGCPVVIPQCRPNKPCGCAHGANCNCHGRPKPERFQPKMRCLRCFCRRQVQCPLLGGGPIPTGKVEDKTETKKEVKNEIVKKDSKQEGVKKDAKQEVVKKDAKQETKTKDVVKALGRFLQIGENQVQEQQMHGHDGSCGCDDGSSSTSSSSSSCSDEHHSSSSDDDEHSHSSSDSESDCDLMEMDKLESGEKGALEKSLPFYPATCGSDCVCYACERPRRPRHRHHHRHHHRVYEGDMSFGDEDSDSRKVNGQGKTAQQKTARQIVSADLDGNFVQEKIAPQADPIHIAIQEHAEH